MNSHKAQVEAMSALFTYKIPRRPCITQPPADRLQLRPTQTESVRVTAALHSPGAVEVCDEPGAGHCQSVAVALRWLRGYQRLGGCSGGGGGEPTEPGGSRVRPVHRVTTGQLHQRHHAPRRRPLQQVGDERQPTGLLGGRDG